MSYDRGCLDFPQHWHHRRWYRYQFFSALERDVGCLPHHHYQTPLTSDSDMALSAGDVTGDRNNGDWDAGEEDSDMMLFDGGDVAVGAAIARTWRPRAVSISFAL
jgi:hypothetical protein